MIKGGKEQLKTENGFSIVKHLKTLKMQSKMRNTIPFHFVYIGVLLSIFSIITTIDASSSENVYIRSSYGQLVTSSTLR